MSMHLLYAKQHRAENGVILVFFYLLKSFNPSVHGMEFFATPLKIYLKLFQLIRMQGLDISSPEILIPFFLEVEGGVTSLNFGRLIIHGP